ncbi:sec-independent translocase [Pirellula sp. SH-Sr6A]|uniref:Sec-independent protein translocase subunit TatA/TatB n=1 Tax=Pirellula sp. SH-Sr6A TaxID=1632865 RepID=UPI00078CCFE7|nr:twin-arginine translocase TatA/TatE family subunit [Pirellula sp. SH-Sr6A]AMV30814.1 sec-independent translocase [Pirellula sp. SH-Sr6A]
MNSIPFAIIGGIGSSEMVMLGIVALMLFGSRLPEVARNLGGTYRNLRRSVDDFKKEFEAADPVEPRYIPAAMKEDEEGLQTDAPKFTPPPSS